MRRAVLRWHRIVCLTAALAAFTAGAAHPTDKDDPDGFRTAVEADWAAQEARRDRLPGAPDAIHDALVRAQRLLEDVAVMADAPDLAMKLPS